jgi:hypothetical protein
MLHEVDEFRWCCVKSGVVQDAGTSMPYRNTRCVACHSGIAHPRIGLGTRYSDLRVQDFLPIRGIRGKLRDRLCTGFKA